jgi:tetratricopeptide (TPR) repeat protein
MNAVSTDLTTLADEAQQAATQHNWPEALHLWTSLERLQPDQRSAITGIVTALHALGRHAESEEWLRVGASRFPDDRWFAIMLGRHVHQRRDWAAACVLWATVREVFPKEMEGYASGARALAELCRFDDAERIGAKAVAQFPDAPQAAAEYAHIARLRQDHTTACIRWAAFRERFPDDPQGYVEGGTALHEAGQLEEVEALLCQGEARFPASFPILAQRARSAMARNDWITALECWARVREKFPGRPDADLGMSDVLSALGRHEENEALLANAVSRHPDHRWLRHHHAQLATDRGEVSLAVARWQALIDRYPDDAHMRDAARRAAARHELIELDHQLEGGSPPEIPTVVAVPLSAAEAAEAMALLGVTHTTELRGFMLNFESLGSSCEFGLVQRHFGAEPLGLLRWASITPRSLVAALDAGLHGIGDPAFTDLRAHSTEYFATDVRWHIGMHTYSSPHRIPIETMRTQYYRRTVFLREKLLADLADAGKIFVHTWHHSISPAESAELARALRRFGPTTLLLVGLADAENPPGSVPAVDESLLLGYLDRLGNRNAQGQLSDWNISFRYWLELCQRAHGLWQALPQAMAEKTLGR